MTKQQDAHLQSLKDRFSRDLDNKYRTGQKEHGGNLWDRDTMTDAIQEGIDMVTYLYTTRDKIAMCINKIETATIQLHSLGVRTPDGYAEIESIKQLLIQAIESLGENKTIKLTNESV